MFQLIYYFLTMQLMLKITEKIEQKIYVFVNYE